MRLRIAAVSLLLLAGCVTFPPTADLVQSETAILLLGEQHDEPGHHALEREMVQVLASRGVLAALALEMADRGTGTASLAADATEAQVRSSLHWDEGGWPWADYGPAVMAAVSAGVPVVGANLPRGQVVSAMADSRLDTVLPEPAVRAQEQAVRSGHCGLLPENRIAPMARVQIARDQAIAATLVRFVVPGKTVLLIAGGGHSDPKVGVPLHLPVGVVVRSVELPAPLTPRRDYCAELRRDWRGGPGQAAAAPTPAPSP